MRIIVLSGGGAKGNYQRGVLKNFDLSQYNLVAGTSVGSLNGLAVAMGKEGVLDGIWENIENSDVYKGKLNIFNIIKALIRKRNYILDYSPLLDLLNGFKGNILQKDFVCNTIDLDKEGQVLHFFKKGEIVGDEIINAVLASSTIPLIFKPVNKSWIDGGIISNSLLGDILDFMPYNREDVEEILAINCNVRSTKSEKYKTLIQMASSIYSRLMTNLVRDDVDSFISKNIDIKNGNNSNTKYKYIPLSLVEPEKKLDLEAWDFDHCHYLYEKGINDGKNRVKNF